MLLTKQGITFDVSHPTEIARLKQAGFVETKVEEPKKERGSRNQTAPSQAVSPQVEEGEK